MLPLVGVAGVFGTVDCESRAQIRRQYVPQTLASAHHDQTAFGDQEPQDSHDADLERFRDQHPIRASQHLLHFGGAPGDAFGQRGETAEYPHLRRAAMHVPEAGTGALAGHDQLLELRGGLSRGRNRARPASREEACADDQEQCPPHAQSVTRRASRRSLCSRSMASSLGPKNFSSAPPRAECSARTLMASSAGVASKMPGMPQNNPPNHNARNTTSGLTASRRPTSSGWTICPWMVASST